MTALTRSRRTPRIGAVLDFSTRELAAGAQVFGGGLVLAQVDGYVRSGAAVAGSIIGVARGNADNTAGGDGDASVIVDEGTFGFPAGAITFADIGSPVYVEDDQTVTLTSGTAFVGLVSNVLDGVAYITISSELSGAESGELELSSAAPASLGNAAAAGASIAASPSDHVHVYPSVLRAVADGSVTVREGSTDVWTITPNADGACSSVWAATITSLSDSIAQHGTAAGNARTLYGQRGASGFVGGTLTVGGGAGGTSGTNKAGAFRVDLGAHVANISAEFQLLQAGASFLGIFYSSGIAVYSGAAHFFSATAGNCTWNATGEGIIQTTGDIRLSTSGNILLQKAGTTAATIDPEPTGATLVNVASGASLAIQHNGTTRLTINSTGVALFAATPAAQPADMVALTDNSGGTADNTIQAIPDPADAPLTADALRDDLVANALPAIRNDIADLTAKVNALRTALRSIGGMA